MIIFNVGRLILRFSLLPTAFARTVEFAVEITHALIDPVGNGPRMGILANGTFPGPQLIAQVGDDIEFFVRNRLKQDTAIHFHGIHQASSPWSDGTPGVSQIAIKPGAAYLYRWRAEEAGVFFYHGHSRGHIMDGLYGAIVIKPSEETETPFHLISADHSTQQVMRRAEAEIQPLLIADYTQLPFEEFDRAQNDANVEILCMDAIVVNGGGSEYCLSRNVLDELTDETVWALMKLVGMPGGLTDKGCLPPLQIVQGDFDMNLTALPEVAFDKCIGGSGQGGNFTVDVNSTAGWAALSFINPGAQHPLLVTIDNHELYVFQIDGQYIVPTIVDQIAVGNGNRISVLVKLDQKAHRYAIRITHQLANQIVAGFAELVYDDAREFAKESKPLVDYTGKPRTGVDDFRMLDETHGVPYPPKKPSRSADRTYKLVLKKIGHPSKSGEWSMSGQTGYMMSEEDKAPPLLFEPPNIESDLLLKTQKGEWVDLIVETEGPISRYHPMHKHGNRFFVLGFGTGRFPWDTVGEAEAALPPGSFNFETSPFVDTIQTKRSMTGAWLALRYKVEASGAFLFHCHIQPHMTGGMGVVLMDGLETLPTIPAAFREWNGLDAPQIHHSMPLAAK